MVETNQTDEELAKASLRDKRYFDILVQRYANRILRYIGRLIGNYQEAEDVTQEVFLKAFVNLADFNPKLKFSSWLYRIAHNESVNFIRQHYRHQKISLDKYNQELTATEKSVLEKIIESENIQLVRWGLGQIRPNEREIIELICFEEKSYLETADILKRPVNSIGPILARAKQSLKKIIEEKHGGY